MKPIQCGGNGAESRAAVISILETLERLPVEWAICHNEGELALGAAESDIDIVANQRPRTVYRSAYDALIKRGLRPVLTFSNGIGTDALFILTPDGTARVDLDVTFDPHGLGRYGLRSGVLLKEVIPGRRWPRLSQADTLLYRVTKNTTKGNLEKTASILKEASTATRRRAASRAREVLRGKKRVQVIQGCLLQRGNYSPSGTPQRRFETIADAARLYGARLRSPAGLWVHLTRGSNSAAEELARALGHVFPYRRIARFESERLSDQLGTWMGVVAPARYRVGLVVSWGPLRKGFKPDLVIPGAMAEPEPVLDALEMRTRLALGAA
jgi:hypothetical protein